MEARLSLHRPLDRKSRWGGPRQPLLAPLPGSPRSKPRPTAPSVNGFPLLPCTSSQRPGPWAQSLSHPACTAGSSGQRGRPPRIGPGPPQPRPLPGSHSHHQSLFLLPGPSLASRSGVAVGDGAGGRHPPRLPGWPAARPLAGPPPLFYPWQSRGVEREGNRGSPGSALAPPPGVPPPHMSTVVPRGPPVPPHRLTK